MSTNKNIFIQKQTNCSILAI